MSQVEDPADDAGERYRSGAGFAFQDAMQRRLRYHLLRLTVAGLSQAEVLQLVELARLAFEDGDVTAQVAAIRERPDASALASALAAIVERAGPHGAAASRADVIVGAVIGAYAGLHDAGGDRRQSAVIGATGGAIAASYGPFIRERIAEVGLAEYLRTDEAT